MTENIENNKTSLINDLMEYLYNLKKQFEMELTDLKANLNEQFNKYDTIINNVNEAIKRQEEVNKNQEEFNKKQAELNKKVNEHFELFNKELRRIGNIELIVNRLTTQVMRRGEWYEEAKEYIKNKVVVSLIEMRTKYPPLTNSVIKQKFLNYCKGSVTEFVFDTKGSPNYFVYADNPYHHFHTISKLLKSVYREKGSIPNFEMLNAGMTQSEIEHAKTFLVKYFPDKVFIDINGIYSRRKN